MIFINLMVSLSCISMKKFSTMLSDMMRMNMLSWELASILAIFN